MNNSTNGDVWYGRVVGKKLPWWRTGKDGFPIEFIIGKPVTNFIRLICQNIRKPQANKSGYKRR